MNLEQLLAELKYKTRDAYSSVDANAASKRTHECVNYFLNHIVYSLPPEPSRLTNPLLNSLSATVDAFAKRKCGPNTAAANIKLLRMTPTFVSGNFSVLGNSGVVFFFSDIQIGVSGILIAGQMCPTVFGYALADKALAGSRVSGLDHFNNYMGRIP